MSAFEDLAGGPTVSAGRVLTDANEPPEPEKVAPMLAGADRLIDLDVLFWRPGFLVDPIVLLRQLGLRSGRSPLALWPGAVKDGIVTYSAPGHALAEAMGTGPVPPAALPTPFDLEAAAVAGWPVPDGSPHVFHAKQRTRCV